MGVLITIINTVVTLLTFTVIIYTFLRFLLDPYHPVMTALGQVIEPLLTPIRKYVSPIGGLDFSPLILIIVLQILGTILVALVRSLI